MSEFEKCLKRGTLRHFDGAGHDVVESELRAAQEDLADAEFLAVNGMPKRTRDTTR